MAGRRGFTSLDKLLPRPFTGDRVRQTFTSRARGKVSISPVGDTHTQKCLQHILYGYLTVRTPWTTARGPINRVSHHLVRTRIPEALKFNASQMAKMLGSHWRGSLTGTGGRDASGNQNYL